MSKYKYLGKVCPDVGKKGLDNPVEYINILKYILEDYKKGKISKNTARGRLLLLYRLTFSKNNKKIKPYENKPIMNKIRLYILKAMKLL